MSVISDLQFPMGEWVSGRVGFNLSGEDVFLPSNFLLWSCNKRLSDCASWSRRTSQLSSAWLACGSLCFPGNKFLMRASHFFLPGLVKTRQQRTVFILKLAHFLGQPPTLAAQPRLSETWDSFTYKIHFLRKQTRWSFLNLAESLFRDTHSSSDS